MGGAQNTSNVPAAPIPPPPMPNGAGLNVTAVNATTNEPHHAVRVIPVSGLPLIVTAKDEPNQKPLFHCPIDSKDEQCLAEHKDVHPPHHHEEHIGNMFAEFELEPCNPENPNQLQVVMLTDDRFNEENRQPNRPLTPTEYLIGCSSKMPLLGGRTAYKVEPQFRRVGRNKFVNYMRKRSFETLKKRNQDEIIEEEIIELQPQYAPFHRQSEEERLNFLDIKSPFKRYIGNAPDHHHRWGARCAEFGDVDGVACSREQLHRNMQFMKVNKPAFNQDRRRELDAHLFKRATMSENGALHRTFKKRSLTPEQARTVRMFKRQQELKEEEAKMDYVRRWAEGNAVRRSFEPLDGPLLLQRDFDEDEDEDHAFVRRHLDEDNVWETRSPKGGHPGHPGGAGFNGMPRPMAKRDLTNAEEDEKLETRSFNSKGRRGGGPRGPPNRRMRKRALSENGLEERAVIEGNVDDALEKRSNDSHNKWRGGYNGRYNKRDLQDDELEKRSNKNRGWGGGSHGGWHKREELSKRDLQDDNLDDDLEKRSNKNRGWGGGSHGGWHKREEPSKLTKRAVSESGKDDLHASLQKRDLQLEDDKLETRSIGTTHKGGGAAMGRPGVNNAAGGARPAGMKRSLEGEGDKLETRSIGTSHGRGGHPGAGRGTAAAPPANNVAAGPAAAQPNRRVKRDVLSDPIDIDDSFEKRSHSHGGPYNAGRGWKKRDLIGTYDEQDGLEKRSNGNSYKNRRWKRSNPDDIHLQKRQVADLEDYDDVALEKRHKHWGWGKHGGYRWKREEDESLDNPALVRRAFSDSGKDDLIANLQKRNQYWAGGGGNYWAGQWGGGGGGGGGGEGMRKRQIYHPKDLHFNMDRLQEFLMEHGAVHDLLEFEHEMDRDRDLVKRGPRSWDGRGPGSDFGPRRGRRGWRRWRRGPGPRGPGPRSRGRGPPPPPSPGDYDWGRRDLEYDDDDALTVRSVLSAHGDIFPRGFDDFAEAEIQDVQKRDEIVKAEDPVVQKRDAATKAAIPTVQKRDTIASAAWNWAMKKLL
ncbi:uncharacterized protein FA14DRAFT_180627 [Meira miltonrushii]|uniref:Uncharacterized protein n=1 Tax=Meira miltonrushii TaxID=1280837 RepID=A0A316V9Q7_9BASI|nr:uncharacterized protein FA14DRAFT_180627 [Meira miltonrushii]PWN33994.1 hypothetical protein FA14DRAFT_180627 [Meira miltonrushii]